MAWTGVSMKEITVFISYDEDVFPISIKKLGFSSRLSKQDLGQLGGRCQAMKMNGFEFGGSTFMPINSREKFGKSSRGLN